MTPEKPANGKRPAGTAPTLVFKPDQRAVQRAAWTRRLLFAVAVVALAAALLLIIRYRPVGRPAAMPGPLADSGRVPALAGARPLPVGAPATPSRQLAVQAANVLLAGARSSRQQWRRVAELAAIPELPSDSGAGLAARLDSARVLAEEAVRRQTDVRQQRDELGRLYRQLEARDAYRLSVVNSAAERYLELLDKDVRDRQGHLAYSTQAVQSLAAGDRDDAEVKLNAAQGYLRLSEERQRQIDRQEAAVDAAVKALAR